MSGQIVQRDHAAPALRAAPTRQQPRQPDGRWAPVVTPPQTTVSVEPTVSPSGGIVAAPAQRQNDAPAERMVLGG